VGYADDIVLVGGSVEKLQNKVNRVHEASCRAGLCLNTSKAKVMDIISFCAKWTKQHTCWWVGYRKRGTLFYLGAMITENYDDSKEIKSILLLHKKCNDFTSQNLERQGNFNYHKEKAFKIFGL